MSWKKITYISLLASAFVLAGCFEAIQHTTGTLPLAVDLASSVYFIQLALVAVILLISFVAIRFRQIPALVRCGMVIGGIHLLLCLYYLLGISTQLFGLGLMLISYLFIYRDIEGYAGE